MFIKEEPFLYLMSLNTKTIPKLSTPQLEEVQELMMKYRNMVGSIDVTNQFKLSSLGKLGVINDKVNRELEKRNTNTDRKDVKDSSLSSNTKKQLQSNSTNTASEKSETESLLTSISELEPDSLDLSSKSGDELSELKRSLYAIAAQIDMEFNKRRRSRGKSTADLPPWAA